MSNTPTTTTTTPRPGVQFNPPPLGLSQPITEAISRAVAALGPDKNGALVGIVSDSGVNAAVVIRYRNDWAVQAWIGKKWSGDVTYGAEVKASW